MYLNSLPTVVVGDPDMLKQILVKDFAKFHDRLVREFLRVEWRSLGIGWAGVPPLFRLLKGRMALIRVGAWRPSPVPLVTRQLTFSPVSLGKG